MTQRDVDVIRHGEGELLLPRCDVANCSPTEMSGFVFGGQLLGLEILTDSALDVKIGGDDFNFTSFDLGESAGTRLEVLTDDNREVHFLGPDVLVPDIRPHTSIENVSIRKIVPGGGG